MYSKNYLMSQLAVALGGRVAEEIVYGEDEVTTGASNDLQQVRNIARRMVTQWGFAFRNMGDAPVAWETTEGNGLMAPQAASVDTEREIDAQVKLLVEAAYENCYSTLEKHRDALDELTNMLIEKETVDYQELQELAARTTGQAVPKAEPVGA